MKRTIEKDEIAAKVSQKERYIPSTNSRGRLHTREILYKKADGEKRGDVSIKVGKNGEMGERE